VFLAFGDYKIWVMNAEGKGENAIGKKGLLGVPPSKRKGTILCVRAPYGAGSEI